MVITERRAQLPIGKGGELNRLANEQWKQRLIELVPVKNEVIWVNPNFRKLPFDLQLNQESPLGLFAKTSFSRKSTVEKLKKGSQAGEIWPVWHNRSALLGRVMLADNEGQVYRDIDFKGIGYVKNTFILTTHRIKTEVSSDLLSHAGRVNGLLDMKTAQYDRDRSEEFNALGIRTSRALAIVKLSEIVLNGESVPIKTLKENGVLPKNFHPVIEVRAFKNKARIHDYIGDKDNHFGESWLLDTKTMISQELGLTELMTDHDYFMWLAQTIGQNTALMHKNGWKHGFLNGHNLTLDGSIVDLDSVSSLVDPKDQRFDFSTVYFALMMMHGRITNSEFDRYFEQFKNSYEAIFSPEEQMAYFDRKREEMLTHS